MSVQQLTTYELLHLQTARSIRNKVYILQQTPLGSEPVQYCLQIPNAGR